MSAAIERFNRVQRDYFNLVQASLARWDAALADVRHRRGSPSGLVSDTIASWLDVATFSLSLLTDPTAPESPQTHPTGAQAPSGIAVSLTVKKNQPTASASKVVDFSADTQLTPTALTRTDVAEGPTIPAAKVKVHLDDGGRILIVQLVNMKKVSVGNYRGAVNDQSGTSRAAIIVTVQ